MFATALSPFTRRLRPNHKRAIARVVARLIDNLGDAAAEHFHGWEQRADLPDEEKDVDQLDADLGWYALQNFRDDIQDASRTTGKPTTTRRRTPLKSRSPLKGRRSSAGTVPTPRRQLDMNLSDVRCVSERRGWVFRVCSSRPCVHLFNNAGGGTCNPSFGEAQASVSAFPARSRFV